MILNLSYIVLCKRQKSHTVDLKVESATIYKRIMDIRFSWSLLSQPWTVLARTERVHGAAKIYNKWLRTWCKSLNNGTFDTVNVIVTPDPHCLNHCSPTINQKVVEQQIRQRGTKHSSVHKTEKVSETHFYTEWIRGSGTHKLILVLRVVCQYFMNLSFSVSVAICNCTCR